MSPVASTAYAPRGIPASAFLSSPGVKVFKQEESIRAREAALGTPYSEPQGRRLLAQELSELRNTPLHEVLAKGKGAVEEQSLVSAPNVSTVVGDRSMASNPGTPRHGTPTRSAAMRFGSSASRPNSPSVARMNSGRGAPPVTTSRQPEFKQGHTLRTTPVRSTNSPVRGSTPVRHGASPLRTQPVSQPTRPSARNSPLRQSPAVVARGGPNSTAPGIRRPSPVRRG
jgi:hypothetical protein